MLKFGGVTCRIRNLIITPWKHYKRWFRKCMKSLRTQLAADGWTSNEVCCILRPSKAKPKNGKKKHILSDALGWFNRSYHVALGMFGSKLLQWLASTLIWLRIEVCPSMLESWRTMKGWRDRNAKMVGTGFPLLSSNDQCSKPLWHFIVQFIGILMAY